jgi:hypothetical protein
MERATMAARKLTSPSTNIQCDSAACALGAFGYCRVSIDQRRGSVISLDQQRRKIESRCVENGWTPKRVYIDAGISGSTPLRPRPEGARLPAAVKPGDVVAAAKLGWMCWSVMKTRHEMRSRSDWVGHNLVANTLQRRVEP